MGSVALLAPLLKLLNVPEELGPDGGAYVQLITATQQKEVLDMASLYLRVDTLYYLKGKGKIK